MARPTSLRQSLPGLLHILQRFRPYLRREWLLIAGSLFALIAEVCLRLLEPWPLKFIFDRVIVTAPSGGRSDIPLIDGLDSMTLLTLSAAAVVVLTGLRALAAYGSTVALALVGNRVLTEVRADLYRHLQRLSLSFYAKRRDGDLTLRVIGDVGLLKEVAVTAALPLFGNILVLFGMIGVMFWLNTQLALLALSIIPLFWLSTVRLSRRIRIVSRLQREREGAMAANVAESIGAMQVVQALSLEGVFAEAFGGENRKNLKEGVKVTRLSAALERSVDVLIAIGTGLVLWYGARLVLGGTLTPGDLLIFLTYLKSAFRPVRDFAKYTARLSKASAAGERVIELLDHEPEVRDLPTATPAPAFRGIVQFEEVGFAYEPGHPTLHDVDFEVHPGQYVALVGPSGAGKSTLTSLLLRLYDPTRGRVLIDGRDIRDYTIESLRSQVSVVLQGTILFAASVRDNIAYGAPHATPEAIEAAARLANAHAFIQALPRGYDTVLGERGVTLSAGQRQRISVARTAVRATPILILDEPTTGLDEENEGAVTEALTRLARDRTTFLITHDLHLAPRADLILYIDNGRVAERGTHAELMRTGGKYAAMYRMQLATHRQERNTGGLHAISA